MGAAGIVTSTLGYLGRNYMSSSTKHENLYEVIDLPDIQSTVTHVMSFPGDLGKKTVMQNQTTNNAKRIILVDSGNHTICGIGQKFHFNGDT